MKRGRVNLLTFRHTSKSKSKKSKKRAAGRKGTVDEYDYLVASLGRLVIRMDEKSGESFTLAYLTPSRGDSATATAHPRVSGSPRAGERASSQGQETPPAPVGRSG